MSDATVYGVAPNESDWYYCANIDRFDGETDYMDGYATGDRPTITSWTASLECAPHSWVGGMMYVSDEDLDAVSAVREVTCERCDTVYGKAWRPSFKVIEWQVKATPSRATRVNRSADSGGS